MSARVPPFIIVTGGVMSSIGKGITSSSIALLLRAAGQDVTMAKVDPYLNIDAGTMNPFEHGECFVLDDGMEADLDLGNYERFLERDLTKASAITSGQIYSDVLSAEREGRYLGKTVQMVPHITEEIVRRLTSLVEGGPSKIVVVEVGGTVGDIESEIFYCALRAMRQRLGRSTFCHVHVSIAMQTAGLEIKTKPTQHSVQELNKRGIVPDILCLRLPSGVTDLKEGDKAKLAAFCGHSFLLLNPTCPSVYGVPAIFQSQGLLGYFGLKGTKAEILAPFDHLAGCRRHPGRRIAIVGKYLHSHDDGSAYDGSDAYLSLRHALDHAAVAAWGDGTLTTLDWYDADEFDGKEPIKKRPQAMILTGGFGSRGYEGFIQAAAYARDHRIPILGICLGFQLMAIDCARAEGYDADTTEKNPEVKCPIIHLQEASRKNSAKGGTLRRGGHLVDAVNPPMAKVIPSMVERFRHRYHLNTAILETHPLPQVEWDGYVGDLPGVPTRLTRKDHPFYWATQAHCELTSCPSRPSPYFVALLNVALDH